MRILGFNSVTVSANSTATRRNLNVLLVLDRSYSLTAEGNCPTLIADARHSWLDALSSAGALAGLVAVACGQSWGDPVAGLAVTLFICHVGYEVTADVMHRLADGIDPDVISTAEAAAGSVPGVVLQGLRERSAPGVRTHAAAASPS